MKSNLDDLIEVGLVTVDPLVLLSRMIRSIHGVDERAEKTELYKLKIHP